MRAIENRVPIVRSGNTGISGMILPSGVTKNKIDLNESSICKVEAPIMESGSFYTKYGNIFVFFVSYLLLY